MMSSFGDLTLCTGKEALNVYLAEVFKYLNKFS